MNYSISNQIAVVRQLTAHGKFRSAIILMDEMLNTKNERDPRLNQLLMMELSSYYEQLEQMTGLSPEEQQDLVTLKATIFNNCRFCF